MGKKRTIKLMADYSAPPLWEPGGDPYPLDPEDLPLTEALRAQLWGWAELFETLMASPEAEASDFSQQEVWQQFVREGATLAALLREELGPAFEVKYFYKS